MGEKGPQVTLVDKGKVVLEVSGERMVEILL